MFLHCVYLHQQSREKSGNELPISQTRSVNLKSKVVRGFLGIIYGRKFATRFEAFSICQITVTAAAAGEQLNFIILSKPFQNEKRKEIIFMSRLHFSNSFAFLKIIVYLNLILDRHRAWRSLDPTLDIWSNFVKKEKKKKEKHFTSSFAILFLSPPLLH